MNINEFFKTVEDKHIPNFGEQFEEGEEADYTPVIICEHNNGAHVCEKCAEIIARVLESNPQ